MAGATKSCHNADCGRTIPDSAAYCPYCGDETSGLAVTHTQDRLCYHESIPGGSYCTKCGAAVDPDILKRGALFKALGKTLITIAVAMLITGLYIFAAKRVTMPLSPEIRRWAYNETNAAAPDFRRTRQRMRHKDIGRPQDLGDAVAGYLAYGFVIIGLFGALSIRNAQRILAPAEPPYGDIT